MLKFNSLISKQYKSAYESEYDLSLKKQFSTPKIYISKGDLNKRWYVYFSYRNPKTNKLVRQTPFYGNANTFKTKEERLTVLSVYRQTILNYLKIGFNPYEDNRERYNLEFLNKESSEKSNHKTIVEPISLKENHLINSKYSKTIEDALSFDMMIKRKTLRDSSLRSYKSHINVFSNWLKEIEGKSIVYIVDVDRSLVSAFLNHILEKTSARNRNNYRASLSSLFQCLEDNEIIMNNIVSKIKVLKSNPKKNKRYSKEQYEQIFKYLAHEDPLMLLYIKFIAYNFLRPLEVCRLKVGDLNIENKSLSFKAKNSPLKTKIIPEALLSELPDLSKMKKDSYMFTPNGIGKTWDTKLENRRGYFTKRFSKLVKVKLGLGLELDHTLYSFRHTFITKLYRELVKKSSPFEAKSKLMQITGHFSMEALEKYLREVDAELPEDYSDLLK